jgi:hypothetical protein
LIPTALSVLVSCPVSVEYTSTSKPPPLSASRSIRSHSVAIIAQRWIKIRSAVESALAAGELTDSARRQADRAIEWLRENGVDVELHQERLRVSARRMPPPGTRSLLEKLGDVIERRLVELQEGPQEAR